ncbi:MAG TPA: hypothetical protein VMT04_00870 [Terriglobales bacterium]|nr:hypothetical protein [Terriglobales bacterium]
MKKTIPIILLAFLVLFFFSISFAQKKAPAKGEEHHHLLTVSLRNASEHAKALAHYATVNKVLDKKIANEHGDAIGKYLDAAKNHLTAIEGQITEEQKKTAGKNLTDLDSALAGADMHYTELKAELAKETLDPAMIKAHSTGVYNELEKAMTAHKALMTKHGVQEAKKPSGY